MNRHQSLRCKTEYNKRRPSSPFPFKANTIKSANERKSQAAKASKTIQIDGLPQYLDSEDVISSFHPLKVNEIQSRRMYLDIEVQSLQIEFESSEIAQEALVTPPYRSHPDDYSRHRITYNPIHPHFGELWNKEENETQWFWQSSWTELMEYASNEYIETL